MVRAHVLCGVIALWPAGAVSAQDAPRTRYDGQKLVRVTIDSARTLMLMEQVSPDCWSHRAGVGLEAEYRVRAEDLASLDGAGVRYEVVIEDIQKPIDEERARLESGVFSARGWFDDFKPLDQVRDYCNGLVAAHPGIASLHTLGHSLEGREIFAIRFTDPADTPGKPVLFFNATQHAREWITVMSVMYIADALAGGYAGDPDVTKLLDTFAVYIVPVANPDGYAHTWTNDRLWRKNKRVVFDKVYGVDLNRNWGFQWGIGGSSGTATSEVYRGTEPFSEPESGALRDFLRSTDNLAGIIDFHSYGQLLLLPWGYTPAPPEEFGSFMAVGAAMNDAIFLSRGARYGIGSCNTKLYPVSGSEQDWAYGELGVPTWIIELTSGPFTIAPTAIVPTGQLSLGAVLALAEHICPADTDGNGFVNGEDFDSFIDRFAAGLSSADFDRNGFVNGTDFERFVDAFERGCF